jgi:NAD(P)-dependent dehydrogenase (short-subunit alcohol dehydrogenase family)
MSTAVQGKTVLVTGARGGIGQALVKAFLEAGAAQVIAADRSPPAQPIADPRVRHLVLDVTDAQAAQRAAGACEVDVVVNNAGANGNCGLFEGEADQARREMEVNYFGVLNMARAFAPAMKNKRGGAMVQVLSFAALSNIPAMGSYSASKAAARSLTQALRAEQDHARGRGASRPRSAGRGTRRGLSGQCGGCARGFRARPRGRGT